MIWDISYKTGEKKMTDKEIKQALEDIAEIRHSIRNSMKIIGPLLLDRSFALFSVIFGVLLALLLSGAYCLSVQYGAFDSMPISLRWLFIALIGVLIVGSGILKQVIIKRILRKQDRSLTFYSLFKFPEFRNIYVLVIYGMVIIAAVVCQACIADHNSWWIAFPAFALYFSFVVALFGVVAQLLEYRILSIIWTISGLVVLFFMKDNQLLFLAAYVLVIFVSYGVTVFLARGNRITGE
jgi:hypothetical protein